MYSTRVRARTTEQNRSSDFGCRGRFFVVRNRKGWEMAEETEVLAPDTEVVDTEAPEDLDTAEVETEDSDTEQAPDTRDFDAELTAAREEARTKAIEEAKQGWEAEAFLNNHRQTIAQSQRALSGDVARAVKGSIQWAVEQVDSGKMSAAQVLSQINEENLVRGYAGSLASAVATQELAMTDHLDNQIVGSWYKDWRVPPELLRAKELARAQGDTVGVRKATAEIIRRAVLENEAPSEAKKLAAAEAEKNKKAQQVASTKAGDARRAAEAGPTNTTGGGASRRFSLKDLEAMSDAQFDALPFDEQMRLSNLAHGSRR